MTHHRWTIKDIPPQHGKIALVTGANSGLGLEATRVLCEKGAHVIMAVRDTAKGDEAMHQVLRANPLARVTVMHLDLADFDSIHRFSEEFHQQFSQLHILILNAGVMAPKNRELTRQGFELQFGVNHLGHFLLTGLLLDLLVKTPDARIAVQSSMAHWSKMFGGAQIRFDNLNSENGYQRNYAYGQSKLANLLFAYELHRQLKARQLPVVVTAAHPGYTLTNLQRHYGFFISRIVGGLLAMKVQQGVLPILRAATDPQLQGGEYIGPDQMGGMRGYPVITQSSPTSYDTALARKLWEVSEELTGFSYPFDLLVNYASKSSLVA